MPSVDQVLVKQLVENLNANSDVAGVKSEKDFGFMGSVAQAINAFAYGSSVAAA